MDVSTNRRWGLVAGDRAFLAEVQARHPRRRTAARALLDEMLTGDDLSNRTHAAIVFGLEGCRYGIGPLKRLVAELVLVVEASDAPWVGPPERNLLHQVLWAVGRMDTRRSHNLLARLIRESTSPLVRADAIEGTTFEEERFDLDLVLPFVSEEAHPSEILSALYALEFRLVKERPEEARRRVSPLLGHPDPWIRDYAIRILRWDAANLDLIRPLADDPNPNVRTSVEEAIRIAEEWVGRR